MKTTNFSVKRLLTATMLLLLLTNPGCKKVDDALDYALNFDGIFENSTGWQVTLDGKDAGQYTKQGASVGGTYPLYFCFSMERQNETTWKGSVRSQNGFSNGVTPGKITINGDVLTVLTDAGENYSLNRVTGGGGSGGGTGSTTEVLVNQCVSGSTGDKKIITINVPANIVRMEVRTVEEAGSCDRNAADLFVRKGSNPVINSTTPYNWTADYSSIQPNRNDEACIINNPGQGSWSIMLFGYNTFFNSKLKVTLFR